jgi:CRISPR-associated protein Csy1
MEATLTQAIADYIEQRKQNKLEPLQKALNKVLEKADEIAIARAKAEYAEQAMPIEEKFNVELWLTDAAKRAKQLSLATHAPKYTHSDSKSSSIFNSNTIIDSRYLNTASLDSITQDFSGNSASFDVASLLKITVNGVCLLDQLKEDHIDALSTFTNEKELLEFWKDGFKLALADEKLSSHTLSKQLYFPLKSDDGETKYHLLCPLFSSSLAHKLHKKVTGTRFGDSKEIRDARRAHKYHDAIDTSFLNTAIQSFGGSKPQNISQLNSERYGQNYLLNAAPPVFKAQVKPPITQLSIFNRQFTYKVSNYLRDFKTFLTNLTPEQRNFKIRYQRDHHFTLPIIDQLMIHAANIQRLEAGWATLPDTEIKLKQAHALWLDVYNPNHSFQQEREKQDWLTTVATDFASWLIKQLKNNEHYQLSDIEHAYFAKLCLHQLKRFERATPKRGEL